MKNQTNFPARLNDTDLLGGQQETISNYDSKLPASPRRRDFVLGSLGTGAVAMFSGVSLGGCLGGGASDPTITGVEFIGMPAPTTAADQAAVSVASSIKIAYSDGTTKTQALTYNRIVKTGDMLSANLVGGYFDINNQPIMDTSSSAATQFFSDCPDGNSLLSVANPTVTGVTGNTVFLVTQYEYVTANNASAGTRPLSVAAQSMYGMLPSPISVIVLDQNKTTGALTPVKYHSVDTRAVHGLWITCAASLSPWNTHLSSEEYEPDAVNIATNAMFRGFSQNLYGSPTAANPYHYAYVPEVTVKPDGTATIVKHYSMGRIARELIEVMPDNKTVIMGDDGTDTGLFMFIANAEKDLSSGTLYVAKWTQTASAAGGAGTLTWIKLGNATNAEVAALADIY
ncbi:MAG: alkaline phosphatase PhoX, partial [Pseudomonadota bacterium]